MNSARKRLAGVAARQVACLIAALLLAGFWLFLPVVHGSFFATRPVETAGNDPTNALLPAWYAVAATGAVLWLRRPTAAAAPMLITLAAGYAGLFIGRKHFVQEPLDNGEPGAICKRLHPLLSLCMEKAYETSRKSGPDRCRRGGWVRSSGNQAAPRLPR